MATIPMCARCDCGVCTCAAALPIDVRRVSVHDAVGLIDVARLAGDIAPEAAERLKNAIADLAASPF